MIISAYHYKEDEFVNLFETKFERKAQFKRDSTLEEDIFNLINKHKDNPTNIYIRHMMDSLIIMVHNNRGIGSLPNFEIDRLVKKLRKYYE